MKNPIRNIRESSSEASVSAKVKTSFIPLADTGNSPSSSLIAPATVRFGISKSVLDTRKVCSSPNELVILIPISLSFHIGQSGEINPLPFNHL